MGRQSMGKLGGIILVALLSFVPLSSLTASAARVQSFAKNHVYLKMKSSGPIQAGQTTLSFELVDTLTNELLKDLDLRETHTKKLHLFIYDAGLKEFQYLLPEFVSGVWTAPINLPKNGRYFVWVQGQLYSDSSHFLSSAQIEVKGGVEANPVPETLGDIRVGADGASRVKLDNKLIYEGLQTLLPMTFSRKDGFRPEISQYLGQLAHISLVRVDGTGFTHLHPVDNGIPNQMMLNETFPLRGDYRIWIQYIDRNQPRQIALSVTVVK